MLDEITQEKQSIEKQKRQMLDEVNTEKQKVSDMRNELQKEREDSTSRYKTKRAENFSLLFLLFKF